MAAVTRWVTQNGGDHSQWYVDRFRRLAADGEDLAGEARLVDAMVGRRAHILDAGCGTGRVGAELAARGHDVVGVDADTVLIAAAQADHPGINWLVADLAELDLAGEGQSGPFDAAVLAGNVMAFVAPGTEQAVLTRVAAHLHADGFLAVGFGTERGYALADFDRDSRAAGLTVEHRFATWDLRPFTDSADFAVTILRTPRARNNKQER
ncbi:MAG: class I SAM-dependent methyltransferase [Actinomycetota bacterium]|nr:class I SAM-dependent methyltransferase [Actinomycetota bacterium]